MLFNTNYILEFFKKQVKGLNLISFLFILNLSIIPFKMIFSPIVSLSLLLLVFIKHKPIKFSFKNKILCGLFLFYFIQLLSYLFTYNFDPNINRVTFQIMFLVVPLIFILVKPPSHLINKTFEYFVWSCFIFTFYSFCKLGYHYYVDYIHRDNYNFIQRSIYHFHYPYDVLFLNVANILLLFTKRFSRVLKAIIFLFFFSFILLSGTRVGFVALLFVLFVFITLNIKRFLNYKFLIIFLVLIVSSFFFIKSSRYVNDKFFGSLDKLGFNTSELVSPIGNNYHKISLRNQLWTISFIEIKKNKFFGYGPGSSKEILNEAYKRNNLTHLKNLDSHNQYLSTLLELGIVGFLLLCGILCFTLYKLIKIKRLDLVLIVLVIMLALLTESVLLRQKGIAFFSVIFCLLSQIIYKQEIGDNYVGKD